MTVVGTDGKKRCFGGTPGKELYAAYHDREWGVPAHEDRYLFEMLILEGAQAGLSWETVLHKRTAYRQAFHNFEPELVAHMDDQELQELCRNPKIIRHRAKIFSARQNARVFVKIQQAYGSFARYLWDLIEDAPLITHRNKWEEIPSSTPESRKLSKDLQKRGMAFAGPTIVYSTMQAVGLVNDHLADCWTVEELVKHPGKSAN